MLPNYSKAKVCDPIVSTSNFTWNLGRWIGLEIITSCKYSSITKTVISNLRIEVEMEKLQEIIMKHFFFLPGFILFDLYICIIIYTLPIVFIIERKMVSTF